MKTVLTVWCGQCSEEGRAHRGKLGVVEEGPPGVLVWRTEGRQGRNSKAGSVRRIGYAVQLLSTPARSCSQVPDRLHAVCPRHGAGGVSSADVIDKQGTVSLNLDRESQP